MSENLNHVTGGTFTSDDLIDEQTANTKFITVQAATPSPRYDGTVWVDTTADHPTVKIYDETNTNDMTLHERDYDSVAKGYWHPLDAFIVNGDFKIQYGTGNTVTYLWMKANGEWYGLSDS